MNRNVRVAMVDRCARSVTSRAMPGLMRNFWFNLTHFIRNGSAGTNWASSQASPFCALPDYPLYRMLRDIHPDRVVSAAIAMPASEHRDVDRFRGGAYFTITFYDFFSLRTIGARHVPYRIAAMAAFTSYSIGHNLGATVFTGGAIRFRIYSACGLT